jgi:hypothetical protein
VRFQESNWCTFRGLHSLPRRKPEKARSQDLITSIFSSSFALSILSLNQVKGFGAEIFLKGLLKIKEGLFIIYLLSKRSPPPVRIVPIIRIWIIVILSPEVNLLAQKKRVGIFQFTKAHDFSSQDFTCDGDSPSSSEDIRVYISFNEDDESSFGAFERRFFRPIKRALQDDNEGRSVFLIGGFNNLSTPDDDLTFIDLRILENLLEAERSVYLDSQFP